MARFGWSGVSIVFFTSILFQTVTALDEDQGMRYFGLSTRDFLERIPRFMDVEKRELDLSKRDVCTDAIPGTKSQICSPSDTLCCEYSLLLNDYLLLIIVPRCPTRHQHRVSSMSNNIRARVLLYIEHRMLHRYRLRLRRCK